jgi:hypothetical protein
VGVVRRAPDHLRQRGDRGRSVASLELQEAEVEARGQVVRSQGDRAPEAGLGVAHPARALGRLAERVVGDRVPRAEGDRLARGLDGGGVVARDEVRARPHGPSLRRPRVSAGELRQGSARIGRAPAHRLQRVQGRQEVLGGAQVARRALGRGRRITRAREARLQGQARGPQRALL